MRAGLKIGELAHLTGLTAKTIRYYELMKLIPQPRRTNSGYRLYSDQDVERLEFIKRAKHLGLTLEDIQDVLALHGSQHPPCIHVLALLDQKLAYVDGLLESLEEFRGELARLRKDSTEQLEKLTKGAAICSIIDRGIHAKGELALTWLEARGKARKSSRKTLETTS